jgi:ferrous iron transport protein B
MPKVDQEPSSVPPRIAVCGNPNTGKSSLFNRLTGLRQNVGNYPGVTVEKKTGLLQLGNRTVELADLPGTYSLTASSPDEAVVGGVLFGRTTGERRPDAILCVVDATAPTSLFLAAQLSDLALPMVVALNMWDEAVEKGVELDCRLLSARLGVPCIPVSAKTGEGVGELRAALEAAIASPTPTPRPEWPEAILRATEQMKAHLSAHGYSDAELRRILFDGSGEIAKMLACPETERRDAVSEARKILFDSGLNPMACEAFILYRNLRLILADVEKVRHHHGHESHHAHVESPAGAFAFGRNFWRRRWGREERGHGFGRLHAHSAFLDRLFLSRTWGLLLFAVIMFCMFQAVYSWSAPFMDGIDWTVAWLQAGVGSLLAEHEVLKSLVVDGVMGGVGACLSFLPQILILFLFIAVLEDSGYLPRAAFLMDKAFSWCGLSGRSFVPLLSSYACAVPGIMATRTIRDPKARIATILVAPLMSCSARLPIYVLFIGVFIEPRYGAFVAGVTLFGMHLVGLLLSGPVALVLTRFVMKSRPQPFLLELPPYRVPRIGDVALRMFERGKLFVYKAGTIIFAMTVIVWAALYFPRNPTLAAQVEADFPAAYAAETGIAPEAVRAALDAGDEATLAARDHAVDAALTTQSYLGRFGRFIQPVFDPAGFDWKVSVAIASSIPAREVVLSTMGVLYNLGGDVDHNSDVFARRMTTEVWTEGPRAGTPVYTIPMVLAIMVFFALCQQCMATLAVIVREAGWKWSALSFLYMTALAWIAAVAVYQIGSAV